MKKRRNLREYIEVVFNHLVLLHLFDWMSDKSFLRLAYRIHLGKKLHLNSPQALTEKIQWIKLYDRNPLYTKLADKYDVKIWAKERLGQDISIPTLGIWRTFEDIDFSVLPNSFVLKTTHDSGGIKIVRNKSDENLVSMKNWFNQRLKKNMYYWGREWAYKDIIPRIIAEPLMEDSRYGELRDYKFFCFNGEPKIMFIASDRQKNEETKFDFFDMDYHHLVLLNGHPNSSILPEKPVSFELMKQYAKLLAKDFPFVRVDFYEISDKPYLGEMTYYHNCGFVGFQPEEWDFKMGEWLILPEIQKKIY